MKQSIVPGIFLTVIGLIFIGAGAWWANDVVKLSRTGLKAQAVMLGYEDHTYKTSSGSTRGKRYPKLRFTDAQNIEHTALGNATVILGLKLVEGQTVPIIYDASHPKMVQVDLFLWKWLGPIIIGLIGLGVLINGMLKLKACRKTKSADGLTTTI